MQCQAKALAFDVDSASLSSLRQALPGCAIEVLDGATAASLTLAWKPETVDLVIVKAGKETAATLELCRFLVSSGVLGRAAPIMADLQEKPLKTRGLPRRRRAVAQRPHSPLFVLLPASRKGIVSELLKAGAHSCLMLPISAEDAASMLAYAKVGTQTGKRTQDLELAQAEDRWRDDGGQSLSK